jgi:dienelactone hydrolase
MRSNRLLIVNKLLFRHLPGAVALIAMVLIASPAWPQKEIPPPQGKGQVVVFVSGIIGPKHDKALSEAIAALGYDVVICDGRDIEKSPGESLRSVIEAAQQAPHALPGKVALVGVSLGGGFALAFGSRWTDVVAVDIVWYPATGFLKRIPGFANLISVPVLMFVGESDHFRNCCTIDAARSLADGAKAANTPFELVTYPGVDHDFIKGGFNYDSSAYKDALDRTTAKLRAAFAN